MRTLTNNTIPNVPRELLERAIHSLAVGMFDGDKQTATELRALLSATSPAGVDVCKGKSCGATDGVSHSAECFAEHERAYSCAGVDGLKRYEVFPYLDDDVAELDICESDDGSFVKYDAAAAIIDGLRGKVGAQRVKTCTALKERNDVRAERDQQAQRIGELAELAAQASVNCKNTAYYLREYRPDLANICSGWCVAIDAALSAGKEKQDERS